jgi:hypothetical protein
MRKVILSVSSLGVAFCLLWACKASTGSGHLITGTRFSFSTPPAWTYSGVWSNNSLLLVDVMRSSIMIYNYEGVFQRHLPAISGGHSFSEPSTLKAAGGRYWLEDEDGKFLSLDARLKFLGPPLDLKMKAIGPQGSIRAVLQWIPSEDHLLVFGDLYKDNEVASAFLWVPIENPGRFEILGTIDIEDPARTFYTVGLPLLAVVNGEPWYLVMDEVTYLAGPGRRFKFTIPGKVGREDLRRTELTKDRSLYATQTVFRQLEEARLLPGIYGWHGALFLLARSPMERGRSTWSMMKLDPRSGSIRWHRLIDSTANHLIVVPGEQYWAFIEKGPVHSPGVQPVNSFLRVPATTFDR